MRIALVVVIAGLFTTAAAVARQAAAPPANPASQAIRNAWNGAKLNIRESAEQMPEGKYTFKPVDGVKTFGAILAHVAGANYDYCAAAKGEAPPFSEDHFEQTAKTKAEIQKAVSDAIAFCDPVYEALTDQTMAAMVSPPGRSRPIARAAPLVGNISHTSEHYGNLVTYFRINGMVPPSTARQSR